MEFFTIRLGNEEVKGVVDNGLLTISISYTLVGQQPNTVSITFDGETSELLLGYRSVSQELFVSAIGFYSVAMRGFVRPTHKALLGLCAGISQREGPVFKALMAMEQAEGSA